MKMTHQASSVPNRVGDLFIVVPYSTPPPSLLPWPKLEGLRVMKSVAKMMGGPIPPPSLDLVRCGRQTIDQFPSLSSFSSFFLMTPRLKSQHWPLPLSNPPMLVTRKGRLRLWRTNFQDGSESEFHCQELDRKMGRSVLQTLKTNTNITTMRRGNGGDNGCEMMKLTTRRRRVRYIRRYLFKV